MKKKRHNYEISIPNQPGAYKWNADTAPTKDEYKTFQELKAEGVFK